MIMDKDFEKSYCPQCHCFTTHKIDCKNHVVTYSCSVCKRRKSEWERTDDDKTGKAALHAEVSKHGDISESA